MKYYSLLLSCIMISILFLTDPLEASAADNSNDSVKEHLEKTQKEKESNEGQEVTPTDSEAETETAPLLNDETPTTSEGVSVTAGDYIKMIFALLLVVGLLYLVLRFLNKSNRTFQQNRLVQNLGGMGVGQGKSIQLMQIGNSLYVVGIGENITLLKEITDPKEIEELTTMYEENTVNTKAVPYVMEIIQRFRDGKGTSSTQETSSSFKETFQKRLQEVKKDRSNVLKDWKAKERNDHE